MVNSIEISDKQKEQLLEMCKVLFPEYACHEFYITEDEEFKQCDFLGLLHLCGTSAIGRKEKPGTFKIQDPVLIHWFEFCISQLVDAIAWENIETDLLADVEYESFRMIYITEIFKDRIAPGMYHPVDYLYEQFRKLKNENKDITQTE